MTKEGTLGLCSRPGCGAPVRYLSRHYYANIGEHHEYELEKVVRLYSDEEADEEGYDPMLFRLRHRETERRVVWTFYWGKDKKKKWRVGQFPPLLSMDDLKRLLQELEAV